MNLVAELQYGMWLTMVHQGEKTIRISSTWHLPSLMAGSNEVSWVINIFITRKCFMELQQGLMMCI